MPVVDRSDVQEYYGRVLRTKTDLKTTACCSVESMPPHIRKIAELLDDEITVKFYSCGSPIPAAAEGCTVLDLGCGSGRDSYIVSKLVGEHGRVIGIEMTDEQLEVADRHRSTMAERFGYSESNVEFRKGYIEEPDLAGIAEESVDIVISNCVVNLSFDKHEVLRQVFRVLKPGGEFLFSDVFASRRIPERLRQDPVLIGECIAGAFYDEDFRRAMDSVGCPDVRTLSSREILIQEPEIERNIGMTRLFSRTVRAFKIETLEVRCEDYGQHATYLGTLAHEPHGYRLDDHHFFETGRPMLVCGNTASMLQETRLADHFRVAGDRSVHFGLFDCAPPATSEGGGEASCC